ncbi:U3 small nucleolar RNA-associated protein 14 homolog A [Plodia interpunctella]|uniref:U3 small nucleolar RNA-associated protein 14 homolog A n=1 Tax=Plodia interpunctella TaxID=58824 RepID=UPI0023687FC8|nr:U3 small nucleolar RNA-associated protein 14 homolog A [Plodia interpunctella]
MDYIEDSEYVASEHDRLVSAVSKLDKTQHITEPTRNESTNHNSEFNLIKRSNKLDLSKAVNVLKDTNHGQISKNLRKAQDVSAVLPKPLEKPQAERIKRATGYDATKKKVGRWDPVVAHSRTVDYVTFPLKNVSTKPEPANQFISKFTLKSALEKELDEIDPPLEEVVKDEEDQVYPMSYLEMVEQRQHLAKIRAQQSYQAAKAKRQSKIKSKKYHRILKKEKLKQQLKEFEELQKENPEEALKKLEALEKARALERHTLRHKNTGKWAKNQMIRAKYDKDVRQQIADQLAVSRSLTKKIHDTESTDDEVEDNENVPDLTLTQDPMNPWMMKRSDKSNVDASFDFGYKKYLKDRMFKRKDDSDTDSNDEQDDDNKTLGDKLKDLKESFQKIGQQNQNLVDIHNIKQSSKKISEQGKQNMDEINSDIKATKKITTKLGKKSVLKKPTATTNWIVETTDNTKDENIDEEVSDAFDSLESKASREVNKKLKKLRQCIARMEKTAAKGKSLKRIQNKSTDEDNVEYLKLKNQRPRIVIDEELIEATKNGENEKVEENTVPQTHVETPVPETTDTNIDPNRFIEVKPKYLNTAVTDGESNLDQLDDDEQVVPKVNIEEVFEEDDVVASFRQEKEDEVKKDQLEDIDLSLPGWGSWGGKGIKAKKRKRNRFILRAPPKMPRRDDNKGDIIIKEFKNPQLISHKVTQVPFPFKSVKDYEASIRVPIGNTFIPEKAHKELIRPSVITKAGTIIEPMDEDELLQPKNKRFKNMDVLKLLGKQ